MEHYTELLIIGAGPFGLAMAAYARHLGIDFLIVGRPMEFWKTHMPEGMYLRSACDWHLDPLGVHTIERFLDASRRTAADVEPLSLQFYLSYTSWFQTQKQIEPLPVSIQQLEYLGEQRNRFRAITDDGRTLTARHVLIAVGFAYFKHLPPELVQSLPPDRVAHTCDLVNFEALRGKRCLIVGGRQSAFEWAALLNEAGAAAVHISYRHHTPAFQAADWSWVSSLVDQMVENPGWFRTLPQDEKDLVTYRLWAEGRLKVEPWLEARVMRKTVSLWPRTQIVACDQQPEGDLVVQLNTGQKIPVDQVILATGYSVQMDQIPFLATGNILQTLVTRSGYPVLDEHFQTTVPGLFVTSMPANQDFGPFFSFTISVRTSAQLIGQAIENA